MEISAQRSRTCCWPSSRAGSCSPRERSDVGPLLGLITRSGAVTPASLCTLTRNSRVPCATNFGIAAPCRTLTRLSALISTWTRTNSSNTRWISRTAADSSASPTAALIALAAPASSG